MRRAGASLVALFVVLSMAQVGPAEASPGGGGGPDFNGDGFEDLAVGVPRKDVNGKVDAGAVHVFYGSDEAFSDPVDQVFHQDTPGMTDTAVADDFFGDALAAGDFDGDGRDDLAVGAPDKTANGKASAGVVHIVYGSASGLSASGDQVFHQDTPGMADTAAGFDDFGTALAAGDYDGDGRDDLAVGIPLKNVNDKSNAGAVHIIYGSSTGLSASGDQVFHQDTAGVAGTADPNDEFGDALAAGDFDGDGRDDLAVGIPFLDLADLAFSAGAVHIVYGSTSGLSASGDQVFHQDSPGMADTGTFSANFGSALATGDFDGDGRDDLAVGIHFKDSPQSNAGNVHVIYGSAAGLTSSGDQVFHQDVTGMADTAAEGDVFGRALAAGDFDGNGRDDLVVGIPLKDLGDKGDAGAVHVVYGSSTGLTTSGDQILHEDTTGMAGTAEPGDEFGDHLTAADFDGDGLPDLAVGIQGKEVNGETDAGAVHVIFRSPGGLTPTGDEIITGNTGTAGAAEGGDEFGDALAGGPGA